MSWKKGESGNLRGRPRGRKKAPPTAAPVNDAKVAEILDGLLNSSDERVVLSAIQLRESLRARAPEPPPKKRKRSGPDVTKLSVCQLDLFMVLHDLANDEPVDPQEAAAQCIGLAIEFLNPAETGGAHLARQEVIPFIRRRLAGEPEPEPIPPPVAEPEPEPAVEIPPPPNVVAISPRPLGSDHLGVRELHQRSVFVDSMTYNDSWADLQRRAAIDRQRKKDTQ